MDGTMSGYFLMMDDISSDYGTAMKSQRKTAIMEVSYNYLLKTYTGTAEVTECGPWERINASGGNEWLNPDGSRPDGSRPQMGVKIKIQPGDRL
jgi:hypothetical protein